MFIRKRPTKLISSLIVFLALAGAQTAQAAGQSAGAKAAALNYPTKVITLVVPVSPGGGFDTLARAIAPYLQKYLPNKPNVIVKNIPGGEWAMGINYVMRAKPDGYTIGMFNLPGNVVSQITGHATYDLNKVSWLGCITNVPYVAALSPKSKFKTIADMKNAPEVLVGTTGLASTSGLGVIIAMHNMGIKPRFVMHKGSNDIYLSAMRGDLDYVQQAYGSIKQYLDTNKLTPLCVFTKDRVPTSPDVPTIAELGYPELADFVSTIYSMGTTPDMPPAILRVLRDAFDKSVADPDFQKIIERGGYSKNPIKGGDLAPIVKSSIDKFGKYKDLILQYMK